MTVTGAVWQLSAAHPLARRNVERGADHFGRIHFAVDLDFERGAVGTWPREISGQTTFSGSGEGLPV